MKKKRFLSVLIGGLALLFPGTPFLSDCAAQPSPEKPMVIDFADWLPPKAPAAKVHMAFAKDLEKATKGAVKTKFHWAQSMGKAKELYGLTVDGIADIGVIVPAYTPGVFPLYSVFELPIQFKNAEVMSSAAVKMYEKGYFDKEFDEVKVIGLYTISSYIMQSIKHRITKIDDLKGLKIRTSASSQGKMAKAFKAVPVQTTAPQMYTNLLKGVTDVDFSPLGAILTFKTHEIVKYITEWRTFTTGFIIGMNKNTWKDLPKEAKNFIDKNWQNYSARLGAAYDANHAQAKSVFLKKPDTELVNFHPGERGKMDKALAPIWENWIANMEKKGHPAKRAVKEFYNMLNDLGVKDAFVGYTPR